MRFIENNKQLAADQFAQTFLTELSRWTNQTAAEQGQQDDITLLVVDFKHR
jgi:serine phosphatase RsbU (regulator of sigma subunit)